MTYEEENKELRGIFTRCVDIIGFHNGDDAEKLEAIRNTMMQAPHIRQQGSEGA